MITCTPIRLKTRNFIHGYKNDAEEGVWTELDFGEGLRRKLNIRPPYQREFVYSDRQRNAVIHTLSKNLPLGVVYIAKNTDGSFEVIDGQQRLISICSYLNGEFSCPGIADFLDSKAFNLATMSDTEIGRRLLDYDHIYFEIIEGSYDEKLDWFRTINIAGEVLTEQELLNANYCGPWLEDAKRKFSKTGCPAYKIGEKYLSGTPIRQDYLETALRWKSGGKIKEYMETHQSDPDATELWGYYKNVIEWIPKVFKVYRKEMKGLEWGKLYDLYHGNTYNADEIETKVASLMADEDVTKKKGIYEYVFSGDSTKLSIRAFSEKDKRVMYEKQHGKCPIDGKHYEISEMDAHHIKAWQAGGKTEIGNCVMLAKKNHAKYIHTTGTINPDTLRIKRDELVTYGDAYRPIVEEKE